MARTGDAVYLKGNVAAPALPPLAKAFDERHCIIMNDWQTARQASLISTLLRQILEILQEIDFTPLAIRADMAELINCAAPRL